MRRAVLSILMLALLPAGCGGGPTAPPLPSLFVLGEGPHTLTVTIWRTTHTNPYGFTSSTLVCSGGGPASAAIPVSVSREGTSWVVRADTGTLRLDLADAAAGHEGSIVGTAQHAGVSVTINDGAIDAPAHLPPGAASATSVGGRIEGAVVFATSQTEQSCSANAWILSARQ